jgi:hypothetical protein
MQGMNIKIFLFKLPTVEFLENDFSSLNFLCGTKRPKERESWERKRGLSKYMRFFLKFYFAKSPKFLENEFSSLKFLCGTKGPRERDREKGQREKRETDRQR